MDSCPGTGYASSCIGLCPPDTFQECSAGCLEVCPVRSLVDGPVIAAYGNWGQCNEGMYRVAEEGANVLIWFSIDLLADDDGQPYVNRGNFLDCVADVAEQLREAGLETTHLISIGGWNSPHVDTRFSSETWYATWKKWNEEEAADPSKGFAGFDGFDWDIEGHDSPNHPNNVFEVEQLELMGRMSVLAKEEGYLVAMAPAQSYLDVGTSDFEREVNYAAPWRPEFFYHGKNTYAYSLAKYPTTQRANGDVVPTFDFVSVQLYEGYSRAWDSINVQGVPASQYIVDIVRAMNHGWDINFGEEGGLGTLNMRVEHTKLVVGLANAWADGNKFILILPEDCIVAYDQLLASGEAPLGYMFWNAADEGVVVRDGGVPAVPERRLYLAKELNEGLRIRSSDSAENNLGNRNATPFVA